MLSEFEFTSCWRTLFGGGNVTRDTIEQAQALVDELPLESPLRVRFQGELNEIRNRVDE